MLPPVVACFWLAALCPLPAASGKRQEGANPLLADRREGVANPLLPDSCFCQLEGQVDDCSCKVDTVDDFNNKKIYPRLKSLLNKDFFRYFQYQPHKKCPFWDPSVGKCTSSFCKVETCTRTDLPPGLNGQIAENGHTQIIENKYSELAQGREGAGDCRDVSGADGGGGARETGGGGEDLNHRVDSTISERASRELVEWKRHDDQQGDFCDLQDGACDDCSYVDLTLNPERFTGYSGEASHRIWRSIYEENCFRPVGGTTRGPFSPDKLSSLCLEKRAFYRAVSGLHTSITIHLTANYPLKKSATPSFLKGRDGGAAESGEWGPNLDLFLQRFDAENTGGQGPYWLKNMYFVYLLELRALAKAANYLSSQTFFTGRVDEDKETVIAVKELLNLVQSFSDHFDEKSMFAGGQHAQELKVEFREHFKNITRVIDCVSCDKCKLWGKLQITGLGTALKILFSGEFDRPTVDGLPDVQGNLQLSRNEIVALFNAFGKISTSIVELERFRDLMRHHKR